ncbi:nucleoside hydrolase-like domain-containing protein, partial [Streptomyces heilongjiangensis]
KPHVILSTDMPPVKNGIPGGEAGPANQKSDLDDTQTLVRFLSYADDFQIDGLIASAATFANYADKQNILDVVDAYAQVYPNLKLHDPNYPTPDSLRAVTKQGRDGTWGQPADSVLGAGKDSEASAHVISVIDKATTPVWFVSAGGSRELGQALWKVKNNRSAAELAAFVSKLRVYLIDDQDGSAAWMRDNFPGLFVITNKCYTGMANTGPYNGTWLKNNVTTGHGALGAVYPLWHWTYNDQGVYEGDTPGFLHLLNSVRGLGDPDSPALGGWGGRFKQDAPNRYSCASDGAGSISRWETARNQDFAARMDWAVKPYNQANHNPVVKLNGDATRNVLNVNATAGSTVALSANGSTDPDGNSLSYKWYQYP